MGQEIPDPAIIEALPPGAQVTALEQYGHSEWTSTFRIDVTLQDGTQKAYFLKRASGYVGEVALRGEFAASRAIHAIVPTSIPEAVAWGELSSSTDGKAYFALHEFRDVDLRPPPPGTLAAILAKLHRHTPSPNCGFGFDVTTCDGAVPHMVEWDASWANFFSKLLEQVLEHDVAANGPWRDLSAAFARLKALVIPRLLGALESDGQKLVPSLIHGDMGLSNTGIDKTNGNVLIWDASSYYAHNEMELGLWRWADGMAEYTAAYLELVPPSAPVNEWDDRNRLYSLKTKVNMSADHPGPEGQKWRQVALDDMQYLCDKYQ